MAEYRVPFDRVDPGEEPDEFDPGPVLAGIVDRDLLSEGPKGTIEGTVASPWGELGAERRDDREVLVETPRAEVSARQVLLNAAARSLGVERALVEASPGTLQELDVGPRVLACPLPGPDAVRDAPADADPSGVPGVEATGGIAYAVTQESPYVKVLGRLWGSARPMPALAAAGLHLVLSEGFRPTYPRTRVVGSLVDRGEASCEVTVQARQAGGGPAIDRVLVGGRVERVDERSDPTAGRKA